METNLDQILTRENFDLIFKITAIIFAIFHLIIGYILYRELGRMGGVFKTKNSGLIALIRTLYMLTLMGMIFVYTVI